MPREMRNAVVAAAVAATLLLVPSAMAAQRYASPSGSGTACSSASPCTIQTAFSQQVGGDEIILATGTYGPISTTLFVQQGSYVHGASGQPAPLLLMAAGHYVSSAGPGSRLSYVRIDGSTPEPLEVDNGTAEADQVFVHASANGACLVYGTLIDAVCWTSSADDRAVSGAASITYTPVLRNVTAEATGPGSTGIEYHTSSGGHITVTASNVIAHGSDIDVFVEATSPDSTTINLDHSNFVSAGGSGTGAHVNVTAKQSPSPIFVNAAIGDFHEAAGSPTIDAGVTSPANGAFDFEGQPRVINGATDIGADEFDPFAGVSIASTKAKVKKRKAKVLIGCPANAPPPCAGTLTLTFGGSKTAGSAGFSIPPGTTAAVVVKVTKKAAKKLAKKGKLATQATAAATDGAGVAKTVTGAVRLKQKSRHK